MSAPTLVWFRQDLRVRDQPALSRAIARGAPVVALYLLDDDTPGPWAPGGASRWWLHHSLHSLAAALEKLNIQLLLARGRAQTVIPQLVHQLGAEAVFWTRQYEPYAIARDTALKAELTAEGVPVETFNGQLLSEPWEMKSKSGGSYAVFSAFWRTLRTGPAPAAPTPAPAPCRARAGTAPSLSLDALELLPRKPDWAAGLRAAWRPGEDYARTTLEDFLGAGLAVYTAQRDQPAAQAVSRLSPCLHFGELSARTVWHAVQARVAAQPALSASAEKFLSELAWREFAHHLLYHHPQMPDHPLRPSFSNVSWRHDTTQFDAWSAGRTGYPVVDAGMRELWQTGALHNRVRMIAASFLVKHLLIPWQQGEAWFWDTLVDADLAGNAMGWQWVTGCGADAAPYFRIFNPVLQGERFDPRGEYIRRFVPELSALPDAWIHKPFAADANTLEAADVRLGDNYPRPIVDHAAARARALRAFSAVKSESQGSARNAGASAAKRKRTPRVS